MEKTYFLYDKATQERLELLKKIEDRIDGIPTFESIHFKKFLIEAIKYNNKNSKKPTGKLKYKDTLKLYNRKPLSAKKTLRLVGDDNKFPMLPEKKTFNKIVSYVKNPKINGIYCDGPGTDVVVDYNDRKLKTGIIFKNYKELNEGMVGLLRKHKIPFKPVVDFNFEGFRFHGIFGSENVSPKFIIKRIS